MSDYTWVTLTILQRDFEQHKEFFIELGYDDEDHRTEGEVKLIDLQFHDVKYGNLEEGSYLVDNQIQYDQDHGSGDEYCAGETYARFFGEEFLTKQFSGEEKNTISLDESLEAFKKGEIEAFLAEQREIRRIPDWII